MSQTQSPSDVPTLFRVTVEVGNLEEAAAFYARLFNTPGQRHPGARHYFQCGTVIVAVLDPTQGGLTPTPGPKSLYFAVRDADTVHQRAAELSASPRTPSTASPPATSSSGPGANAPSTSWIRGATTCASWRRARSTPEMTLAQDAYPRAVARSSADKPVCSFDTVGLDKASVTV